MHPKFVLAFAIPVFLAACGKREPAQVAQPPVESAPAAQAPAPAPAHNWTEYAPVLQHAYLAYFGRPADPAGLEYWGKQLQAANAAIEPAAFAAQYGANPGVRAVLDAFANSEEAKLLYPGKTAEFVGAVYRNLFQRAVDKPGLDYWVNAIDKGVITRPEAALTIMTGAMHKDLPTVQNKLTIAQTFTRIIGERPAAAEGYKGEADNRLARALMAKVNGTTDPAAFDAEMRATIEQMANNPGV